MELFRERESDKVVLESNGMVRIAHDDGGEARENVCGEELGKTDGGQRQQQRNRCR
ncbi:hypothetical protein L195_g057583 [Trifolium pratense]|uniref:Uncharacterized protein n=1 Tax=Trifolium pratense TaxID=57577 RepID=A0A2K3KWG6_TRIPR|nr:hypothetical protein L195_g057583 [Trifolium pratense]